MGAKKPFSEHPPRAATDANAGTVCPSGGSSKPVKHCHSGERRAPYR
jgi:hypothetical protein